jgi:hypothetical protein
MSDALVTLGIDLAADRRRTAACAIRWEAGEASPTTLRRDLGDDDLRALIGGAHWTGIDAPFSWPVAFRRALADHGERGGWPADYRSLDYQLRATDRFVAGIARRPLSVSTDRIGVTAMRCARLLEELGAARGGRLRLTGEDRVVEVYPAAALSAWGAKDAGFDPQGYKTGPAARPKRRALVESFMAATGGWLDWPQDVIAACVESDHALDALIAALVTRAAQLGRTRGPVTDDQRRLAPIEGWIHVPEPGTLALLRGGTRRPVVRGRP